MTEFFYQLIESDRQHAAFLNSLSYLEYRGARKMARALSTSDIDPEVLKHAFEESRHALYFKTLALRIGGRAFQSYGEETLFAASAIKTYFYELDQAVGALSSHRKTSYLITTWLVEERALEVYTLYDRVLQELKPEFRLTPVLKDESQHLDFVRSRINDAQATELRQTEEDLFSALRDDLKRSLEDRS